jgi:hypothetical protein
MEESITDLHNAIHLALSLNPEEFGGDNILQNGVVPLEGSSSQSSSRISSLSGSMIEQSDSALHRLRLSLHNNTSGNGVDNVNNDSSVLPGLNHQAWQTQCLNTAKNVENALSNYELALLSVHNDSIRGEPIYFIGNDDGSNQTSIVDLLVAALTTVPRHLIQQCCHHGNDNMMMRSSSTSNLLKRNDATFVTSMEQICFTVACISANMLMKWFSGGDNNFNHDAPLIDERHVCEIIDEVAVANEDESLTLLVEPSVTVVNSVLERQHIEASMYDDDGEGYYHERDFLSNLSSKDSLLLATSLAQRFISQSQDNAEAEFSSSHISLFISSLLEHFCDVALAETVQQQQYACDRRKFELWADASNEHMERNLNDEEVVNIPALLSQYYVQSIESVLELFEDAESLIDSCRENNGNVDAIITTVQDTIRASMTVISITETMEKLDMVQHESSQIRMIFYPLISAFTKFILSSLQNALHISRKFNSSHDIEGICIIADDLLFRLCGTSIGLEFFKNNGGTGEEEEILALVLLRAMSAGCIQSKATDLLSLAAERARNSTPNDRARSTEESSKRQRFNSSTSFGNMIQKQKHSAHESSMIDVILCCLALSQYSNRGGGNAEQTHIEEVSCITSALMFSDASADEDSHDRDMPQDHAIDPLNPWHSLQLKPLMQLISDNESNPTMEPLIGYTSALPPCADISCSVLD